jgi:6,7-dimethyl-8-ribityllumazine synthase
MKTAPSRVFPGKGKRFAVVASDFNAGITDRLLSGCLAAFKEAGAPAPAVVRVSGAFELPLACLKLARTKKFHAVVALGCVIRGETPHDRYICEAVAHGIMRAGLDTGIPVIFGLLTTLDEKQAWNRIGKGREAALAALQTATAAPKKAR